MTERVLRRRRQRSVDRSSPAEPDGGPQLDGYERYQGERSRHDDPRASPRLNEECCEHQLGREGERPGECADAKASAFLEQALQADQRAINGKKQAQREGQVVPFGGRAAENDRNDEGRDRIEPLIAATSKAIRAM